MDNKKVSEVNGVQEHTGKNDAVESVSSDTADMGVMLDALLDRTKFKGFRKETKPVSRTGFWGYESEVIRKIAREL